LCRWFSSTERDSAQVNCHTNWQQFERFISPSFIIGILANCFQFCCIPTVARDFPLAIYTGGPLAGSLRHPELRGAAFLRKQNPLRGPQTVREGLPRHQGQGLQNDFFGCGLLRHIPNPSGVGSKLWAMLVILVTPYCSMLIRQFIMDEKEQLDVAVSVWHCSLPRLSSNLICLQLLPGLTRSLSVIGSAKACFPVSTFLL
jgi:hypothetical protein